jgi:hypothetical protein
LKPCEHADRERKRAAEEAAARQYRNAVLTVRRHKLATKNLLAMEAYPGEGERWWVMCRYCHRMWHMPEDDLRACPHKGDSDPGHPALPESVKPKPKRPAKPTPEPPAVEEMTLLPGMVGRHAYLVEADGRWSVRVGRYAEVPGLDDWTLLLHAPLAEPTPEAAEEQLRAAGWAVDSRGWRDALRVEWAAVHASRYAEVTSPLLTEYAVGRDVLGSQALKPDSLARTFVKRTRTEPAGQGRDSQGRVWPLYWRAEVEAARRIEQEQRAF